MNLLIQITNSEWRRLNEDLIERAGESLTETERAAVKAFLELAEPHVELAQIEMLRGTRDEQDMDVVAIEWSEFVRAPEQFHLADTSDRSEFYGF